MSDDNKPLTREQFSQLLSYQYGECALCGRTGHLDLDHDHVSMLIRGLLCRECNRELDGYEKRRLRFCHYEAYLRNPPMRRLGMKVEYRSAQINDQQKEAS